MRLLRLRANLVGKCGFATLLIPPRGAAGRAGPGGAHKDRAVEVDIDDL